MSIWSPTKFHRQSGRYCKYQETGQTPRILDASSWQALEPNQLDCHDHYFRINGRWYAYANISNRQLFKKLNAVDVDLIDPGDHLDNLLDDLKQLEPFLPTEHNSTEANLSTLPKRVYRGVVYSEPKPIEPSTVGESALEKAQLSTSPKWFYRGVTY